MARCEEDIQEISFHHHQEQNPWGKRPNGAHQPTGSDRLVHCPLPLQLSSAIACLPTDTLQLEALTIVTISDCVCKHSSMAQRSSPISCPFQKATLSLFTHWLPWTPSTTIPRHICLHFSPDHRTVSFPEQMSSCKSEGALSSEDTGINTCESSADPACSC